MAVSIDIDEIENTIIPAIDKVVDEINEAVSFFSSISIPDDFECAEIRLFPNRLNGYVTSAKKLKTWTQMIVDAWNTANSNSASLVDKILGISILDNFANNNGSNTSVLSDLLNQIRTKLESKTGGVGGQIKQNDFLKEIEKNLNNLKNNKIENEDEMIYVNKLRSFLGLEAIETEIVEQVAQDVISVYDNILNGTVNADEFFNTFSQECGSNVGYITYYYGIDQDCTSRDKMNDEERIDFVLDIMNRYNLSAQDSAKITELVNSLGACTYATICNMISMYFSNEPDLYEEKMGFPLFNESNTKINGADLLLDMYIYENDLIIEGKDGRNVINPDKISEDEYGNLVMKEQEYMSSMEGINKKLLNKYFEDKGIQLSFTEEFIYGKDKMVKEIQIEEMKSLISNSLDNGEFVRMGLYGQDDEKGINYYLYDENDVIIQPAASDANHSFTITGITEEGLIISTWGFKGILKFSELEDMEIDDLYRIDILKFEEKK